MAIESLPFRIKRDRDEKRDRIIKFIAIYITIGHIEQADGRCMSSGNSPERNQ